MDPFIRPPVKPTSKYYPVWQAVIHGEEWTEPVAEDEQEGKRAAWWACLNKRGVPLTAHYDKKMGVLCLKRWTPEDNN